MVRLRSRTTQRIIDFGVLSAAFWLAFLLRFDADIPNLYVKRAAFLWPYVTVLQYAWLAAFKVPRFHWRYVGLRETTRTLAALSGAAVMLLAMRLGFVYVRPHFGYVLYLILPLGVIFINSAIAFIGIVGIRALWRVLTERDETRRRSRAKEQVPTLLIGAGRAGVLVAREIASRPDLGIKPVGFVDDDPQKLGTVVHGLRVLGATSQVPELVARFDVEQAIITIANAPGTEIRRIRELAEQAGVTAKIIPGLFEILDGQVNLARIREVSIEDLLRREVVELGLARTSAFIAGKRVLVTGAGGSIGSEICRQVARLRPKLLVLVERSEFSLFSVHHELVSEYPDLAVVPLLCDVTDETRVERVFGAHQPQIVFHAAAHKHVPMVEWNPGEAIKNNVFGTKTVADAAERHGVSELVLVSTDKAVNPSSIMGATKRLAEIYVQAKALVAETNYVSVRFGNVLGSTGSVVPIFKEQIARGGPVTVTHPEMTRYFMTIPESTELVLEAAALGQRGEIFLLDMGEPVRIVDLAVDLIRLSGLEPYEDIAIEFTGVRPGEKLFEELCFDPDTMDRTRHPKIFVVADEPMPPGDVGRIIERLEPYRDSNDREEIRRLLASLLPEMQSDSTSAEVPTAASTGAEADRSS